MTMKPKYTKAFKQIALTHCSMCGKKVERWGGAGYL